MTNVRLYNGSARGNKCCRVTPTAVTPLSVYTAKLQAQHAYYKTTKKLLKAVVQMHLALKFFSYLLLFLPTVHVFRELNGYHVIFI